MTPPTSSVDPQVREARLYRLSFGMLGGSEFLPRKFKSRLDVHAGIVEGIPYAALIHLVESIQALDEDDIVGVLGVSARTLRRQRVNASKPMPADLASRAWLFAETLAQASEIFGGRQEAERWLSRPAVGLGGQRPIELLRTLQGAELVHDFLGRLEYGVYA